MSAPFGILLPSDNDAAIRLCRIQDRCCVRLNAEESAVGLEATLAWPAGGESCEAACGIRRTFGGEGCGGVAHRVCEKRAQADIKAVSAIAADG